MSEVYFFYTSDLTVGYNGVPLIKDIEIGLNKGEILTLIGPNGAGKTTIIKSLIRELPLIKGSVHLGGSDIGTLSGNELARKLSVVLTERINSELMTCEDVVATGRYPYTGRFGVLSTEDLKIVRESMELTNIEPLAHQDFGKISDGQKQRVMLARAIAQEPELLVLDEPTSFLDIRYKLEFLSVLQKMSRERGLSVVMSMHELDLAGKISDKVACVKDDHIDRFGKPEDIFTSEYIQSLFGLTLGSYDALSWSLELPRVEGSPKVFVIGGCGKGTPVYRALQREGIPFVTGILMENDMDFFVATRLAEKMVCEKAFNPISSGSLNQAMHLMNDCGKVICPLKAQELKGEYASALRVLINKAREDGKFTDKLNEDREA